jgi:preprotein translocase subunit SecE
VTQTRTGETGGDDSTASRRSSSSATGPGRRGRLAGIMLFLRQVVAELKKVVRPTRKELVTYTSVVLVFVLVVMVYVSALDFGFRQLVGWAFGDSD